MNYREAARELSVRDSIEALDSVVGDLDEMLYCPVDEEASIELDFDE